MSDVTHKKLFGSGLTAINEVLKPIFYTTYAIIVFFYQFFYDVLCDF